jgi:hypothetical protein
LERRRSKKKKEGGIVISFMLDVFTRREREGPLAAAATENRPERHTHTHTRVFEEKKNLFFFFFSFNQHIYTLTHTQTPSTIKKNGKIKKHVGRHRCADNVRQSRAKCWRTHTHTQLHTDCVDLYVMGREREEEII